MTQRNGADTVWPAKTITRMRSFGAAIIAATWFYGAAPGMAGDGGGADLGMAQSTLNGACSQFNISHCPQLPTINQVIVEDAAITATAPDVFRAEQTPPIPAGLAVDAGTLVPSTGSPLANPLAFISPSNNQGQPIPTNPVNPAANSFLTATTTGTNGSPTTLDLTFDYHLRTLGFTPGQQGLLVGEIMLPLVTGDAHQNVSPDDLSMPPLAALQIFADPNTCPTCVTTGIVASLTGVPVSYQLSQLGMTFSNDNSSLGSNNFSPNEQFTVGVPLLVPADFLNPLPGPAYLFSAAGHEFANGLFDGIDPVANFLDATFLNNNNNNPFAAVADLAIAFDGSTVMSDPIPGVPEPSTLAVLGGGLLGSALLAWWRRSGRRVHPEA